MYCSRLAAVARFAGRGFDYKKHHNGLAVGICLLNVVWVKGGVYSLRRVSYIGASRIIY